MKLLPKIATILLSLLIVASCSKNESTTGELSIAAKATIAKNLNASTNKTTLATVNVTDFLVNLKEFEIEVDSEHEDDIDHDWDDDGSYDSDDELELKGPFELDLLSGQITFLSVTVPNGNYEEIEFKFGKSTNSNSQLFNKSILIKGTVDSVPFVFWHDFEDELEVDFEDAANNIIVQNSGDDLVINFDLTFLLNTLDLSQATDLNNDGIIEISPNDTDGNNTLANQIKETLKYHIDLDD